MKKIAYLLLPVLMLVFTSCEDQGPEVYDGDSLSYFSETSGTFTIQAGSVYDVEVFLRHQEASWLTCRRKYLH